MANTKNSQIVLAGAIFIAILSTLLFSYIWTWLDYLSYLDKIGIQNTELFQARHFSRLIFAPTFKYFIGATMFLYMSITFFFKLKSKLLGLLVFLLSIWLFIFPLQLYYSEISFRIAVAAGSLLEGLGVILFVLIVISTRLKDQ